MASRRFSWGMGKAGCTWRCVNTRCHFHGLIARASSVDGLAVFHARFYVRVCRRDESTQGSGVDGRSWLQLHMAHELACALQQTVWIRQRRAMEKSHVHVRRKYVDVAEGRIS